MALPITTDGREISRCVILHSCVGRGNSTYRKRTKQSDACAAHIRAIQIIASAAHSFRIFTYRKIQKQNHASVPQIRATHES